MISYIIRGTLLALTCMFSAFLGVVCIYFMELGPQTASPAIPSLAYLPVIGALGCLMICLWTARQLHRLTIS